MSAKKEFEVWKKLKLTDGQTLISCADKLSPDFHISKEARYAIENSRSFFGEKKKETRQIIDLVKIPITELFSFDRFIRKTWPYCGKYEPREKEVWDRAKELGLKECPNNTAFILRTEYLEQPKDERLIIMSSGFNYVWSYIGDRPFSFGFVRFGLTNTEQKLYITAEDIFKSKDYCKETVFVFAKPT